MSTKKIFIAIYLFCLAPRIILSVILGDTPLTLDEIEFDRLAWSLSEGWGYVSFFDLNSTFRPPGYPLFLAIFYSIFGPDYEIARIGQAFITALIGPLTYLLGKKVVSEKAAIYAGFITGFFPTLILFSFTLMSDNFFIPLLLMTLLSVMSLRNQPSLKSIAFASASIIALIFTRSEFTPVIFLFLLWAVWSTPHKKKVFQASAITLAIVAIPAAMWSHRNYVATEQFIYLDSKTGINLHIAFNENSTGKFDQKLYSEVFDAYLKENNRVAAPNLSLPETQNAFRAEWLAHTTREIPTSTEIDKSIILGEHWMHNYGKAKALDYISQHPLDVLLTMPKKFMYFWNLDHRMMTFGYSHNVIGAVPAPILVLLFIIILCPFALITLGSLKFLLLSNWSSYTLLLAIPIIFLTAVHSLTFADARYHYPIIPLLAIFCCGGVSIQSFSSNAYRLRLGIFLTASALALFIWSYGFIETLPRYEKIFSANGNETYVDL